MKKWMRRGGPLALAALLLAALLGCQNPAASGPGSLTISFGDQVSRTILPTISMEVATYIVKGSGPGGAVFTRETTGATLTVPALPFGEWEVAVEALNKDGASIGTGSGSTVIHSNQTSVLSIVVRPHEGFGGLELSLGWNPGDLDEPELRASLLPTAGEARILPFGLDKTLGLATFSATDVKTGYHSLSLQLLDNGALVYGAVEVVRIVKDQTSRGEFFFDRVNKPGGVLSVNISQDMSDPLTVAIAGGAAEKAANKILFLSASIAETGVNATYLWYVNALPAAVGQNFSFDKTWAEGFYRIDVVAISADGSRAGSAKLELEVTPPTTLFDIAGRVRQNGLGLGGVTIGLAGTAFSTISAADGSYRLAKVPEGSYRITSDKAGFAVVPDASTRDLVLGEADLTGVDFTALDFLPTSIASIQGRTHTSVLNNKTVTKVLGVVTLVDAKQFYMESPDPDLDPGTSEGILVFQNAAPPVLPGDLVAVNGTVSEYFPSGASSGNLSVTEIKTPVVTILARGKSLPPAVVIGAAGRRPPSSVICDDATGTVDNSVYDPENDGIDFYESLEFMRVTLRQPRAVGPSIYYGGSSNYRETALVADDGAGATGLTARGGIGISADDFNPEIVFVNDKFHHFETMARAGDRFDGEVTGVLDYTYGVFKIYASEELPVLVRSGPEKEATNLRGDAGHLTLGSYNTENLSIYSPAGDIEKCAATIVSSLGSPDIMVLCEVQDNNGPAVGDTDASISWNAIVAAIQAIGGPAYEWKDIAPVNNADGGAPDGNIRQGFLFNPARVQFVDRAGGTATAATTVSSEGGQALISYSPGRVDPANAAFLDSRKPLIGEFLFNGQKLYVIGNHFNSKGGDTPLWGKAQPPVLNSEVQRMQQAQVLSDFVGQILAAEPGARIALAGDFNDFEFSNPIQRLLGGTLSDLVLSVPKTDRYSYLYSGNSQVLDHVIVSPTLAASTAAFDIVHVNCEYPDAERSSDHDPLVASFAIP